VGASDYSAPAIHISSVLEIELGRRVLAIPGLSAAAIPGGHPTLGTLGGIRNKRPEDWARIVTYVSACWRDHVDPDDSEVQISFTDFFNALWDIRDTRNQAAHTNPVARDRYSRLFRNVCQGGPLRIGALNALLAAWPV
jgi:hypothetical protein